MFPGHRGTGIPPSEGFGRQHTPRVTPGGGHTSSPRTAKCKLLGEGGWGGGEVLLPRRPCKPPKGSALLGAWAGASHRPPNPKPLLGGWRRGRNAQSRRAPGEQVGIAMRFSSEGPECATPPLRPLPYLLSDLCQCHLVSCHLLSVKVSSARSYERAAHVNECTGEAAVPLLSTVGNIFFPCANSWRRPSEDPPWRVPPPSPVGCALFGEVPYTNTS